MRHLPVREHLALPPLISSADRRKGDTMKRSALGGIVAVSLILTALLFGYLYYARTSSGYRMQQHRYTMDFFDDRISSLERQRDLLRESAESLEEQAGVLNKRIQQIDVEIQNMRGRIDSEKKEAGTSFYSWDRFRFTPSSGLIVIAFLVFIWLLYTTVRKKDSVEEEGHAEAAPAPSSVEGELTPGSLREEEFPPEAEASDAGGESPPDAEAAGEEPSRAQEAGEPAAGEREEQDAKEE